MSELLKIDKNYASRIESLSKIYKGVDSVNLPQLGEKLEKSLKNVDISMIPENLPQLGGV